MIRRIMMGLAIATLAAMPAWADPLTCTGFRQHLAAAIDADGNAVAKPDNFTVRFHADDHGIEDPRTTYDWSGIVGLKGTIECIRGDEMQIFTIEADFVKAADEDIVPRLNRTVALAAAAMASTSNLPLQKTRGIASRTLASVVADFKKAMDRGEIRPEADATINYGEQSQIEFDSSPGAIFVSVHP